MSSREVSRDAERTLRWLEANRQLPIDQRLRIAEQAVAELQVRRGHRSAPGFARLCIWVPEHTLAMGAVSGSLQEVEYYAELARDVLRSSSRWSPAYVTTDVHIAHIHGVLLKALRNYDESEDVLTETVTHLEGKKLVSPDDVRFVDIRRQLALNTQDHRQLKLLAERKYPATERGVLQEYTSVKRYFEYLLNHYAVADARELQEMYARLHSLYTRTRHNLGDLGKISYRKNIGHFLLRSDSVKEREKGAEHLKVCLAGAERRMYQGQAHQIAALLEASGGGSASELRLRSFHALDMLSFRSVVPTAGGPDGGSRETGHTPSQLRVKLRDLKEEVQRLLDARYRSQVPDLAGQPAAVSRQVLQELEQLLEKIEQAEETDHDESLGIEVMRSTVADVDARLRRYRHYRYRG